MRTLSFANLTNVEAHSVADWPFIPPWLRAKLADTKLIHRGRVHAMDVASRPEFATYELANVYVSYPMPALPRDAQTFMEPNLPWAEDHFRERVSGEPLNPAPSHEWWPYAQAGNGEHTDQNGQFSHTYPERMWPKQAGNPQYTGLVRGDSEPRYEVLGTPYNVGKVHRGIRFYYGDLSDVVNLLMADPMTRQAFLPIWFPEDTGAVGGQRVPCTIGYHFIRRGVNLDCQYFMRSCDLLRFFVDDAYMAVRLTQWICEQLNWTTYPGTLNMFISNLHAFAGDKDRLKRGGV